MMKDRVVAIHCQSDQVAEHIDSGVCTAVSEFTRESQWECRALRCVFVHGHTAKSSRKMRRRLRRRRGIRCANDRQKRPWRGLVGWGSATSCSTRSLQYKTSRNRCRRTSKNKDRASRCGWKLFHSQLLSHELEARGYFQSLVLDSEEIPRKGYG